MVKDEPGMTTPGWSMSGSPVLIQHLWLQSNPPSNRPLRIPSKFLSGNRGNIPSQDSAILLTNDRMKPDGCLAVMVLTDDAMENIQTRNEQVL